MQNIIVKAKAILVCLRGKNVQKAIFIGTQKSHNVNIKNKVQETK